MEMERYTLFATLVVVALLRRRAPKRKIFSAARRACTTAGRRGYGKTASGKAVTAVRQSVALIDYRPCRA
jgi:hypothetical protein